MDAQTLRYAAARLRRLVRPALRITEPPPGIVAERDVAVTVRDGTALRVNVFRPAGEGPFPTLMCAHPYGKDRLPKRGRRGYRPPFQYRIFRQPEPVAFSALTSWEAPDPGHWVPRGYALVNCDLRGCGDSEGVGDLMSVGEAEDYHDLIEWAAAQPWSTGRVGLNGVSYLALSQYGAAAQRPPALAAICPWEGFSDAYRDFFYPGGVREDGFVRVWDRGLRAQRLAVRIRAEQLRRPRREEWWAARAPDLERIEVPMLVCGSFSDNCLHSRGSFRAFEGAGSRQRWLYTHRGGKWSTYYSPSALAVQERFFDHFLKGEDNGFDAEPPVRLEVREDGATVREVRGEQSWPPAGVRWTELFLGAKGTLGEEAPSRPGVVAFATRSGRPSWRWTVPRDLELSGPMTLRLRVELEGADWANLFAGVEKWRDGRFVGFEGSYGFGRDRVSTGWLRLEGAGPAQVEIELGPSSTWFRAGEELRLVLAGRWLSPRNPLTGQFPAAYEPSPAATCRVRCGGEQAARLLVPAIG